MHFAARYRAPAEAIEAVAEAMRVSAEDEAEEAEAVRERANPGDAGPGDKGFLDASPTGGGARVSPSPGKEKKIKIGGLPSLGPDADGYAPLHLAQGAGDDPDAIAALVRADPGSVLARDAGGCTPLHLAVGNGGSARAAKALLRAGAVLSSASDEDAPGVRLGGSVFSSKDFDAASIASARDFEGRTPLHHAAGGAAGRDVLEALLRAAPASASALDDAGNAPAHLVAAARTVRRVADVDAEEFERTSNGIRTDFERTFANRVADAARALAEACPEALEARNVAGQTPAEVARALDAGADVVDALERASSAPDEGDEEGDEGEGGVGRRDPATS
jgi:ankyrin repeat protein